MRAATLGLMLLSTPCLTAGAQSFGVRGTVVFVREAMSLGGSTELRTGAAWGVEGGVGRGPLALAVRYFQGSVEDSGTTAAADIVEGQVLLVVRPVRWAAVSFGPHARSFVQPGGTQRWLLWELHAQGIAPLVGPALEAYLEGWAVVGASVDLVEPFDRGLGVEGGLRVALGRLPVGVRLRYRVESLRFGGGAREETHEQIALAVGVGRR